MTRFDALILAALALHLIVLVTLGALVLRARRRLRAAEAHAALSASYADSAVRQLTEANGVIRSLEATGASLRPAEPGPADLVLLDAAVRPGRLTDAPAAVPDGCRVETVRHRPQTVLRGPGGRFVRAAATPTADGQSGQGQPNVPTPIPPASAVVVASGGDWKHGWA